VKSSNGGKSPKLVKGSRVFYPSHGVAVVLGMEVREFGGGRQVFHILELARGVKVMLPESKVSQAGIRALVSASKARELMERVKAAPTGPADTRNDHAARRERAATYVDALRSGSPDRYTEILQELLFRARSDKLSKGDQQTLEAARSYFVDEIGAALQRSPEQIEADLRWEAAPPR
jgi:CarD family transcriptional regulator